MDHISVNDIFPQFTHYGKSEYHCELCVPYQQWAKSNCLKHSPLKSKHVEIDDSINGTAILRFSGVVQASEHFKSKVHQEAIDFFKRSASEKVLKVNDDKETKKEATITDFFPPKTSLN